MTKTWVRGSGGFDAVHAIDYGQIKLLDGDVDHANGIVLADPVFQAFRKQRALTAIHALNEAPPNHITRGVFAARRPSLCSYQHAWRRDPEELTLSVTFNSHSLHAVVALISILRAVECLWHSRMRSI